MAWDAYFEVAGLKGESGDPEHPDGIKIFSFGFGGSNMATVGKTRGGGSGTVSLQSFNVTKVTDSCSAELFQAMCSGTHFDTAKLTLYKSGGTKKLDYLVFEFDEVYVDNLQISGGEHSDTPSESVSFAYGAVKVTYQEQTEEGTSAGVHPGSWDIRTAAPAIVFK